jgi:methyl-accepting chemotaxis protein
MNRFVRNLSMGRKFGLLVTIASAMVIVPVAMVVQRELADLHGVQAEQLGIAPARTMLEIVARTQDNRRLAGLVLGGEATAKPELATARAAVQEALTVLRTQLAPLRAPSLDKQLAELTQAWNKTQAAVNDGSINPAVSFKQHEALVEDELQLVEDIAHRSGLSLHAEPAGYFLHLAALGHLPEMAESLAQLRGMGAMAIQRGQVSDVERGELELTTAAARRHFWEAQHLIDLASESEPGVKAKLKGPMDEALTAAEAAIKTVQSDVLGSTQGGVNVDGFVAQMTKAVEAQNRLTLEATSVLEQDLNRMARAAQRDLVLLAGLIGLCSLLAATVIVITVRTTLQSVGQALALAEAVAEGKLDGQPMEGGHDELGRLLGTMDRMRLNLAGIVANVRRNADGVATASAQIATGNQDLSQRTEVTASALQETAASMEQLNAAIHRNAESASEANTLAQDASGIAQQGGAVVSDVVETMRAIQNSSQRMADIIGVIDGIAFQTNILALNAAVEAARAGEEGRGFAVVASEVRALAKRSADAAREIKQLIVTNTERIELGSALVDQAGQTMSSLVTSVARVATLMSEISAASAEQSAGVTQVGEAVGQMDRGTQQNAALVEESAAAADSLRQQADQLAQAVASFSLPDELEQPDSGAKAAPSARLSDTSAAITQRLLSEVASRAAPAARRVVPAAKPAAPARPARKAAPVTAGADDEWASF